MSVKADLKGPYATADQVALALVCACRLVGEDPVAVCGGSFASLGRWYASEALKEAFPLVNRGAISRGVGYRRAGTSGNADQLMASREHKWQPRWIGEIAATLRKSFPAERAVPTPTRRAAPAPQQQQTLTAYLMGDPAPGRSALEQRNQAR